MFTDDLLSTIKTTAIAQSMKLEKATPSRSDSVAGVGIAPLASLQVFPINSLDAFQCQRLMKSVDSRSVRSFYFSVRETVDVEIDYLRAVSEQLLTLKSNNALKKRPNFVEKFTCYSREGEDYSETRG